jgi:hypothetical protein
MSNPKAGDNHPGYLDIPPSATTMPLKIDEQLDEILKWQDHAQGCGGIKCATTGHRPAFNEAKEKIKQLIADELKNLPKSRWNDHKTCVGWDTIDDRIKQLTKNSPSR